MFSVVGSVWGQLRLLSQWQAGRPIEWHWRSQTGPLPSLPPYLASKPVLTTNYLPINCPPGPSLHPPLSSLPWSARLATTRTARVRMMRLVMMTLLEVVMEVMEMMVRLSTPSRPADSKWLREREGPPLYTLTVVLPCLQHQHQQQYRQHQHLRQL